MARALAAVALVATSCTSTTVAPRDPHPPSTTAAPPVEDLPVTTTASAPPSTSGQPAAPPPREPVPPPAGAGRAPPTTGSGRASWYARGARTASGEAFDPDALTAAHRTLAFGTRLRVCHGGRCVEVRVNDRGPASWTGRELDLSRDAFSAIAPLSAGVVDVAWEAA